ncbi:MAG: hypothetical protein ACSLEN_14215 [Candidatus Malihini olakiniferum]
MSARQDAYEVTLETENATQNESYTGQRLQIGELVLGKTGTLTLTQKDWMLGYLALALYGKVVEVEAGTVTAEVLQEDMVIGDRIRLDHPFVSNVVLSVDGEDDLLVAGTDYRVESATSGHYRTADSSSSYRHSGLQLRRDREAVGLFLFTSIPPERWLLLEGINTENNERVVVQLYCIKFAPVSSLSLLA